MSVVYQYQEPQQFNPIGGPSKKKLFFVIGLAIFAVIIMILVAVFGAQGTVQNTTGTTPIADQFVKALSEDSAADVAKLYGLDSGSDTGDVQENIINVINHSLDATSCTGLGEQINSEESGNAYFQNLYRCELHQLSAEETPVRSGEQGVFAVTATAEKVVFYQFVEENEDPLSIRRVVGILSGEEPLLEED